MINKLIEQLAVTTDSKIVLLVIDGLSGIPNKSGKTELDTANIPNLDALARDSICGITDPIAPGITPGSGPAHLSLFGYDPLEHKIGRGLLEALGIDFPLESGDLAVRGNLAAMDKNGKISDRRAGRISTEESIKICSRLEGIEISGIKIFVKPVKEHRVVVIFRGKGLDDALSETDPQVEGLAPLPVKPLGPLAAETAGIITKFIEEVKKRLSKSFSANMILLRGFAKSQKLSSFHERYKLRAAAIAIYPMYRGLARLFGMEILPAGERINDEFDCLRQNFDKYDFFYIHVKYTDSAGEDGNFEKKVSILEEVDSYIPNLLELKPAVLIVTGDHSTPAVLKGHSWHPVPIILHGRYTGKDDVVQFSEKECAKGGIGRISAMQVMTLAMANALKLTKYGA
ncbi:2,3-bisphosphoglycerate-independent phosphoglycerate mutase [bacterium]|nr:2,3-bisphosphoglycerate-independent phosphoglycerate mutase [bacterium]MBU1753192.1 2,3-bisphosphoglycerate-independent phosphoglycerate mutase [bacterium]